MSRARTLLWIIFLYIVYIIYFIGSPAFLGKIVRMKQGTPNISTVAWRDQTQNTSKAVHLKNVTIANDYRYIHNPYHTCYDKEGSEMNVFVIFYASSATSHFSRRQTIRKTFGNPSHWNCSNERGAMRTVFLLGSTANDTLQRYIHEEAIRHGDIVQDMFLDTYLNLTLKTVMGLEWVYNYCSHAQYAIKIDDDTMMNQKLFRDHVVAKLQLTNYAAGKKWVGAVPFRKRTNKFFVSKKEYHFATYPPYLDGPVYILSMDVVQKVYKAAINTPTFKWEDVYIGMCLNKTGVTIQNIPNFRSLGFTGGSLKNRIQTVDSYAFISDLNVTEMIFVWNHGYICDELISP